jgi:hypothetical protein
MNAKITKYVEEVTKAKLPDNISTVLRYFNLFVHVKQHRFISTSTKNFSAQRIKISIDNLEG